MYQTQSFWIVTPLRFYWPLSGYCWESPILIVTSHSSQLTSSSTTSLVLALLGRLFFKSVLVGSFITDCMARGGMFVINCRRALLFCVQGFAKWLSRTKFGLRLAFELRPYLRGNKAEWHPNNHSALSQSVALPGNETHNFLTGYTYQLPSAEELSPPIKRGCPLL